MTWITWLVFFVVPMAVLALLAVAKPVPASTTPGPPSSGPSAPALSADEEADAAASEEDGEEEGAEDEEEEEEEEEENEETGLFPPEECLLRSARAHAVVTHQTLKLTVDYTTYEPANARVEVRRGGVQIGSAWRHLWRSGVLRITKKLAEKPKAERLVVRLRIPGAPPSCGRFQGKTIRIH